MCVICQITSHLKFSNYLLKICKTIQKNNGNNFKVISVILSVIIVLLENLFTNDGLLAVRTYRNDSDLGASKLLKLCDICLGICRKLIV